MRAALYWSPPLGDPLFDAGNIWLGRDPQTGAALRQPAVAGLADMTANPRGYGFHCTLRPPMRLATDWAALLQAAQSVASAARPFVLPRLVVNDVDGFLAITLSAPSPAMQALADCCVRQTNPHRRPPDRAELARRHAAGLTARQTAMLERWGYPYVMQEWLFHMTLSRRLSSGEMARLRPIAEAHFAPALAMPRMVEDICVFTQGDGDFLIAERLDLG